MKAVQITFDEKLLHRLDADDDVRREGRSAVLRRLAAEYLRRKHQRDIDDAYRRGYADDNGLGKEFAGWEEQGEWPKD